MSFKERLFGLPWESKDPEVRRGAITEGRDPRLRARLPDLATADPDPGVRLAALQRLGDESAWLKAARDDADETVRAAADRAIGRAVCTSPAAEATDQRLAWLERIDDAAVLRRIARGAVDAPVRQAALARISAPGFLGDCVVEETDDALAGQTLERIDQPSTLRRIAEALRKQNKKRHRQVMQRLARLEHGQEQHRATDELAHELIERVERIARGQAGTDHADTLKAVERRWRELDPSDRALRTRFDGAMRIARAALQPRRRPASSKPADPEPRVVDAELEAMIEEARDLAGSPDSEETAAAVNDLISRFDRRWNRIGRRGEPEQRLRKHFDALAGELQARLQAWQASRPQPAGPAEAAPASASEARRELVLEALDHAERVLESGDIRASHEAIAQARKRFDALPARQRPGQAQTRLGRMAARLKEMRDWQHWSNNELRERLIERAGEIDPGELHPDAVTARLKELRERWKELDRNEILPGDRRRFAAPKGQWRRFQRACKQAFDAARPYLEKRTEVREQSLAELHAFLDDARSVVGSDETTADLLVRYQRAAREAIRNLDSLPPSSRGKAAAALRRLMDDISAALEACFEEVEARKRSLVAEARKLAHLSDRSEAIDRAKALQAEWKRAGRGRRKVEDRLWREFREPIDPLFEGLREARQRERQAEHEHAEALQALCRKAEELANSDDPIAARGPVAGLEDEFAAYGRVPAALAQRFRQAIDAHRQAAERARAEQRRRRDERLRDLAGRVQQAWRDLLDDARPERQPPADAACDDPAAEALRRRLAALTDADAKRSELESRVRENTDAARQVVIEMECLSGLETPEADRQQRMNFQVGRLSTRLGDGAPRPDLATERAELHRRWWESFPHDPARHDELAKRFAAADRILDRMMDS